MELASIGWLQQRLLQAAARRRAIEIGTLCATAAAAAVLFLAAYALSDWLVRFPRPVRLLLTIGALVAGILALRRHAPRWVPGRLDAHAMARLAERVQELGGRQAHSRLVASMEFGERPHIPGDARLKNRVIREAQSACDDPCRLRLHDPRHVRLAWRLGAGAALALVIGGLLCPGITRVFLQRLAGLQVSYPTATVLEAVQWRAVAPARQSYPLQVVVRGRVPPSGQLRVHVQGRRAFDLPLLAVEGTNAFSAVIPAPDKSFAFTFRLGDFESETYRVRVAEPMYVTRGVVQVEPPAYTLQRRTRDGLANLTVPEGSRLTFLVSPDREARGVSLLADTRPVPMSAQPDGSWSVALAATNSFSYEIVMQDFYGMENADRLKHTVNVIPDNPPVVEVRQPKSDSFISVASLVPFEVQTRDDYGVARLELTYDILQHSNDKDISVRKGTVPLDYAAVTGKVADAAQVLRAADLNVRPGQRVVFRVAASDNHPGRPNVGLSAEIGLQVVEPDELRRTLNAEMTQMAALMRKLRDSERKQEQAILQRLQAEGGTL